MILGKKNENSPDNQSMRSTKNVFRDTNDQFNTLNHNINNLNSGFNNINSNNKYKSQSQMSNK